MFFLSKTMVLYIKVIKIHVDIIIKRKDIVKMKEGVKVVTGLDKSGKTSELIRLSHETKAVIITKNSLHTDYVKKLAEKMGYDIPNPICWKDIGVLRLTGSSIYTRLEEDGVLLDDVEDILDDLFVNVKGLSLSQLAFGEIQVTSKPEIE